MPTLKKKTYYEIYIDINGDYQYKEILLTNVQYKNRKKYSKDDLSSSLTVITKRVRKLNNSKT